MEKRVEKEPHDLIANLSWGTHCCHFYKTPKDLLDISGASYLFVA